MAPRRRCKRNDAPLPGSAKKPLQVLVDEDLLREVVLDGEATVVVRAWKAAFDGLREGFGFGITTHGLTSVEYMLICKYMGENDSDGDVVSNLNSTHIPLGFKMGYKGVRGNGKLVRLGARKQPCEVMEALILAQQYVVCQVMSRGVTELRDGKLSINMPPFEEMDFVSSVHCRFNVVLPVMCGMQDYIRVVSHAVGELDLEVKRSALVSRPLRFPRHGCCAWKSGWSPNIRQACTNALYGTFVVLTLFPGEHSGLMPDTIEETGIYVTVTERIIRGHTRKKGETGRYYEYVPPLNPLREQECRTYFMSMGSTLVIPATYAFRLGAHRKEDVQVFGYMLRIFRTEEESMQFLERDDFEKYEDVDEYDESLPLLEKAESLEFVKWEKYKQTNSHISMDGTVGTIPCILGVQLTSPFRKSLVADMYDVLRDGQVLEDVYRTNPIRKLCGKRYGNGAEVMDTGTSERNMWLDGEEQWFVDDVPYEYIQRRNGGDIQYPFNFSDIQDAIRSSISQRRMEEEGPTESDGDENCSLDERPENEGEGSNEEGKSSEVEGGEE